MDGWLIQSKTQHVNQHFYTQSNVFRSCLNSPYGTDTEKLSGCSHYLKQITDKSNLYVFDANYSLLWQLRQYLSTVDYTKQRLLMLSEKKQTDQKIIRIEDSFVTMVALKDRKVLVLSISLHDFDAQVAVGRRNLILA
ncbi:MAG: hypothetical protein HRU20_32545, partial [Pseudomonadales bacterium]|nr:hypothetical protein [Pseudomonadales bacterium]